MFTDSQFKYFLKTGFQLAIKYPGMIFPMEKNNSHLFSHVITVSSEGP